MTCALPPHLKALPSAYDSWCRLLEVAPSATPRTSRGALETLLGREPFDIVAPSTPMPWSDWPERLRSLLASLFSETTATGWAEWTRYAVLGAAALAAVVFLARTLRSLRLRFRLRRTPQAPTARQEAPLQSLILPAGASSARERLRDAHRLVHRALLERGLARRPEALTARELSRCLAPADVREVPGLGAALGALESSENRYFDPSTEVRDSEGDEFTQQIHVFMAAP